MNKDAMENDKSQEGFTDLSEFRKVDAPNGHARANIVKGMHIVHRGTEEIHRAEHDPGQPDIIVHRDGETILSIEFVCPCGRSTSVQFAYDGE